MDLLMTKTFNGIQLDCYKSCDENDFWATREQIGKLLGYEDPMRTIARIHKRNAKRLNNFSTVVNLSTVEGKRVVFRKVTVYNFRGLLEICRWSNQPNADKVMDFLWDVAEDIRKHGMYISDKVLQKSPEEFAKLLEKYAEEKLKLKALTEQIEKDAPYATLGKVVMALPGSVPVADAAQFLRQHGINIGRNGLYKFGRDNELLSKQKNRWNKPTQKGIDKGFINLELDQSGDFKLTTRTMFTAEGLKEIFKVFFAQEYPLLAPFMDDKEGEIV